MTGRSELSIGDVAEATGVAVTALRYYEQVGVVRPVRRVGGQRRFAPSAIDRVAFVRSAQAAGFSLEEIRGLLDGDGRWRDLVAERLAELRATMTRMERMIDVLERAQYCECEAVAACREFIGCASPGD